MKVNFTGLLITIGAHRKKPDTVFYAGPIEVIAYPQMQPALAPEQGGVA
ncbi:hypothetical protein [Aurantiacibacter xanthus]|nr:hypothetical protein [Aurantiacibacter xanthus]